MANDICRNYHGGNKESDDAFNQTKRHSQRDRETILRFGRSEGDRGFTCYEAEKYTGMPHQTASARISELKKSGHIIPTDRRRETGTGSMARVYVLSMNASDAQNAILDPRDMELSR